MTPTDVLAPVLADESAGLDSILAAAAKLYPVHFETVAIAGMNMEILQISDMTAHVDRLVARAEGAGKVQLPFWAKLWPAALPMAMLLAKCPPPASLLEAGAGVGLCGLVAAKRGVPTLLTDIEPEAVLFMRAAIAKNNLQGAARAAVADFTATRLGQRFETVAASEALYLPHAHEGLLDFIEAHLAETPTAHALLSCDDTRRPDRFLALAQPRYRVQRMQTSRKDPDGNILQSAIYRLGKPT